MVGVNMPQRKGPSHRISAANYAAQSTESRQNAKGVHTVHCRCHSPSLDIYVHRSQPPPHHAIACCWHLSFNGLHHIVKLLISDVTEISGGKLELFHSPEESPF